MPLYRPRNNQYTRRNTCNIRTKTKTYYIEEHQHSEHNSVKNKIPQNIVRKAVLVRFGDKARKSESKKTKNAFIE